MRFETGAQCHRVVGIHEVMTSVYPFNYYGTILVSNMRTETTINALVECIKALLSFIVVFDDVRV